MSFRNPMLDTEEIDPVGRAIHELCGGIGDVLKMLRWSGTELALSEMADLNVAAKEFREILEIMSGQLERRVA